MAYVLWRSTKQSQVLAICHTAAGRQQMGGNIRLWKLPRRAAAYQAKGARRVDADELQRTEEKQGHMMALQLTRVV